MSHRRPYFQNWVEQVYLQKQRETQTKCQAYSLPSMQAQREGGNQEGACAETQLDVQLCTSRPQKMF